MTNFQLKQVDCNLNKMYNLECEVKKLNNLGERLYKLRKDKQLSQEEVAEKLNVTRQTISKWETDQSMPDFDKVVPLYTR